MSTGSDWFREALAKKQGRHVDEPEPEPVKKPLDLGQGARGPCAPPPPTMGDIIRGSIAARHRVVSEEIELERQIRGRRW